MTYENKCAGISTYFSNSADKETDIEFNLTQAEDVTFTASYGKNFESKAVPYKTNVTAEGVEYEFIDPRDRRSERIRMGIYGQPSALGLRRWSNDSEGSVQRTDRREAPLQPRFGPRYADQ